MNESWGQVSATCILVAICTWDTALVVISCALVTFGMGCVWFGDDIGRYTDVGGGTPAITEPTPGIFIIAFGWLVLASSLIAALVALWHRANSV